jgi:hypothetical protein
MRTLYNTRVGLLTPLASSREEMFSRDGYCESEGKGKETFGMRRTGQKKANDVGKRGQQALVLLG